MSSRYALAFEIALAIPPGKSRVPKGELGPLCERYGVSSSYPRKVWKDVKAQIDADQEVDLSNKERSGRPSLTKSTTVTRWRGCGKASSRFTTKHFASWAITTLVWSIPE